MKQFFRPIVLLLSIFMIASCQKSGTVKHGVFVSTDWLEKHLNDSGLVILTAGESQDYDSIHIPGAQWVSIWDLVTDTGSLENEIPPLYVIESVLEGKGISDNSRIILYYDNSLRITRTCRIFMTLDYAGLGDRTFLLNGGLDKWVNEGRATSSDTVVTTPGDLTLKENGSMLLVADDILAYLDDPAYKLLDARPADEYKGEYDSVLEMNTGGHIMGAESLPFELMLNDTADYLFKEYAEIQELFDKTGVSRNQIIIHYCNTGFWATGNYLLAKQLGYTCLFYDGSFNDWDRLDLPAIRPVRNPGQ